MMSSTVRSVAMSVLTASSALLVLASASVAPAAAPNTAGTAPAANTAPQPPQPERMLPGTDAKPADFSNFLKVLSDSKASPPQSDFAEIYLPADADAAKAWEKCKLQVGSWVLSGAVDGPVSVISPLLGHLSVGRT